MSVKRLIFLTLTCILLMTVQVRQRLEYKMENVSCDNCIHVHVCEIKNEPRNMNCVWFERKNNDTKLTENGIRKPIYVYGVDDIGKS